jgi:hypothetical protein
MVRFLIGLFIIITLPITILFSTIRLCWAKSEELLLLIQE